MKLDFIKKTGTVIIIPVFFMTASYAAPKVYSYHIPGEESIAISAGSRFISALSLRRNETFELGIGLNPITSMTLSMDVVNSGSGSGFSGKSGDCDVDFLFSPLFHYEDKFYTSFLLSVKIPTGPDIYETDEWYGQAFGNSDIKLGTIFSFFADKTLLYNLNLFCTLREGPDESFYSGGSANMAESDTYKDAFGFNPFRSDTFLESCRLRNDFLSLSMSAMKKIWFLVLCGEVYYSFHPYRGRGVDRSYPVEGAGVEPLWLKFRLKYVPVDRFEFSLWCGRNLLHEKGYPDTETGFNISLLF